MNIKRHITTFFTMLALLSISLFAASCSDDNNDEGNRSGNSIEINGTEYNLSWFVSMVGSWNETLESGEFTISVDVEHNDIIDVEYYSFRFEKSSYPAVGDDFAQMNLTLEPLNSDDSIWDNDYTYTSGKAVVTNTNPDESEITIAFDNLTMSKDGYAYSFNGTVTLPFEFDEYEGIQPEPEGY